MFYLQFVYYTLCILNYVFWTMKYNVFLTTQIVCFFTLG